MMKKPQNAGRPWTASDVKMLEDDIKLCKPAQEIAKELGRSEEAIFAKCYHEHISVKGLPHSPHHGAKRM